MASQRAFLNDEVKAARAAVECDSVSKNGVVANWEASVRPWVGGSEGARIECRRGVEARMGCDGIVSTV